MFTLVYTLLACAPMVLAVVATLCTMAYMWATSKPIEYHTPAEYDKGTTGYAHTHPYRGSHPTTWEYRPLGRGQYRRVRVTRCEAKTAPEARKHEACQAQARGPPTPDLHVGRCGFRIPGGLRWPPSPRLVGGRGVQRIFKERFPDYVQFTHIRKAPRTPCRHPRCTWTPGP